MAQTPFVPTDEQRRMVSKLAGLGLRQSDIGHVIGINRNTVSKYFETELEEGVATANSQVAQSLFNLAMGGNVAAAIFWAKTRMQWRETAQIQQLGADGQPVGPVAPIVNVTIEAPLRE